MSDGVILGIDTSNYTTSVALLSESGDLIANIRRILSVKPGECGLRQSDAVFAHVKNLPELMREAELALDGRRIIAVGVSERPRNVDGSYMPCFLSGLSVATGISSACGAPLYKFSHQCGHIMAGLYSCKREDLLSSNIAAFHISGGTTELLRVSRAEVGFIAEKVGGTLDLNAGQVIDRIGVMLGLPFPAGASLEALAKENKNKIPKKKPSVKDMSVSLSGLENLASKLYSETNDPSLTAAFVFNYIAEAISMMSDAYISKFGETPILYAGGVMRNSIIRNKLSEKFDACFAEPDMSSDNAVGIAALARAAYLKK